MCHNLTVPKALKKVINSDNNQNSLCRTGSLQEVEEKEVKEEVVLTFHLTQSVPHSYQVYSKG